MSDFGVTALPPHMHALNRIDEFLFRKKEKHLGFKDGEQRTVWLKDLSFPVCLIKKVFKNKEDSTGFLYLLTNDLESDAEKIYEINQKRWRIEEQKL